MPRAKLNLKRAKVQAIFQLEDPAQRYAWERLEEMRKDGTLQAFLRRLFVDALPRPAIPKAQGKQIRPAPKPGHDVSYEDVNDS